MADKKTERESYAVAKTEERDDGHYVYGYAPQKAPNGKTLPAKKFDLSGPHETQAIAEAEARKFNDGKLYQ